MSLHSREIDRAWAKIGMEIREGKHRQALFFDGGRLILRTKRSQGSGPIDGDIPHKIRRQMHLTHGQFQELLACPLGREEYLTILDDLNLLHS